MTRSSTGRSRLRLGWHQQVLVWSIAWAIGFVCVVLAAFRIRAGLLGPIGAVDLTTVYVYGLAARTGGRPLIAGLLALVLGTSVFIVDSERMRTGAAVMVAVVSAVFAIMATTPAVTFKRAARECAQSALVAIVGSLAAIGYSPAVTVNRFQYVVLALSLVSTFLLVYRLGAGLHGLGRRGFATVSAGGLLLLATLLYAEAIRRYGTPGLINNLSDGVVWLREHIGGYPRPIEALLGVPALAWGTHMRARRRQGWWVCAFGVAATAPMASTYVNPEVSVVEGVLSICYSLVAGLILGYLLIRVDLFLTGGRRGRTGSQRRPGRGSGSGPGSASGGGSTDASGDQPARAPGRRAARQAEEAAAARPEPRRTQALL